MLEFEKKLMLTPTEYDFLRMYFGEKDAADMQINYYFDTEDLLMNRSGITCRVRYKDSDWKATMKCHSIPMKDCSAEIPIELRKGLFENGFTDLGLSLLGKLITYRIVAFKDDKIELILDRNEYLGCVDYELEMEFKSKSQKDAEVLWKRMIDLLRFFDSDKDKRSLSFRLKDRRSKSQRYFEKLFFKSSQ